MASAPSMASLPIIRERVTSLQMQQDSVACALSSRNSLLVSRLLAKHISVGDEITFTVPTEDASQTEVLITKTGASSVTRHVYQAAIGYVSHLRQDKRNEYFVAAEVQRGSLGINSIFLA